MSLTRTPEHSIHPLFTDRWSPRAFTGEPIDDVTLLSFFEAARWAPSAYNAQPWRFVYAKNGTENWPRFIGLLSEFNRTWAQNASALVVLLSKTHFVPPGKTDAIPATTHAFDTGAAWANLALQASLAGWHTHAVGGYDKEKAREILGVPADYALQAAIVIGKRGDKSLLSPNLQEREQPSQRRPLNELVAEGGFAFA
ncbi:3-hydroxypropanoate dehydrogenase [Myxococcaceae bacterium]|nr:3-hydroxypropanoate dehydrogenase [Myxococcaceae bacterium]